ncbi:MAG: MarR family winged helix-turn-helix transcriptional regulator, partial [Pseudonocardia sediminis]
SHVNLTRHLDLEGTRITELARRARMTNAAMTELIDQCEQLGLVQREADPADARRKRLRVTPRGHEMMAIGGAVLNDVRERWAAEIGRSELDVLEAHLARLTEGTAEPADDVRD